MLRNRWEIGSARVRSNIEALIRGRSFPDRSRVRISSEFSPEAWPNDVFNLNGLCVAMYGKSRETKLGHGSISHGGKPKGTHPFHPPYPPCTVGMRHDSAFRIQAEMSEMAASA